MYRFLAAVVFVVTSVTSAYAVPISGNVAFGGILVPGTDLGTMTSIPFLPNSFVTFSDGDLAVALPTGSNISLTSFGFAPFTGGSNPVWTKNGVRFDLGSVTVTHQSSTSFALHGTGTVTAPGFDPTLYLFSVSADKTKAGDVIAAYSATNVPQVVPEPSAGVLLLTGFVLAYNRSIRNLFARR